MRRYTAYMSGERYLGNSESKEVHDLEKEKQQCKIDEIVRSGKEQPFKSLKDAYAKEYNNCQFCLNSTNGFIKSFIPAKAKLKS